MSPLVLIFLIVVLMGGVGGGYYGMQNHWRRGQFGTLVLVLVLVFIVLYLTGNRRL